jgi:hypothetical protein
MPGPRSSSSRSVVLLADPIAIPASACCGRGRYVCLAPLASFDLDENRDGSSGVIPHWIRDTTGLGLRFRIRRLKRLERGRCSNARPMGSVESWVRRRGASRLRSSGSGGSALRLSSHNHLHNSFRQLGCASARRRAFCFTRANFGLWSDPAASSPHARQCACWEIHER